jgi:membrane-bound lytic murein transglycosylase D
MLHAVRILLATGTGLLLTVAASGQAPATPPQTAEPAEIIRSVQDWIKENMDDSALDALGVDAARMQQFLDQLRGQFDGEQVYDLAASRDTARQLLPVLEKFEETKPYAAWLKTRLDYLEAAETLRREADPKSEKSRGDPLPAPTPQKERSVWVTMVEKRPIPPRAEKYVVRLREIFAEQKVPTELIWVAEVESSFDPSARSPVGAAGLFQLMPGTARGLDLSLWPWDERLQAEKCAKAAATYLRQLYNRFDDWRLTLAAYNAGEGRVGGLLKKYNARTYDAIASHLPAETQMYVPKVEATIRKREGVGLDNLKAIK